MKELISNFTVEEYVAARNGNEITPVRALDNNNPGWSEKIVGAWKARRGRA